MRRSVALFSVLALLLAAASADAQRQPARRGRGAAAPPIPDAVGQLVLVVTPAWDSIAGTVRRFSRSAPNEPWRAEGGEVPIVVGRTGLAWDARVAGGPTSGPRKREGDGRAPAGIFPLERAFGFAPASEVGWINMPYRPLTAGTECVDDTSSAYYNQVVERGAVRRVDWSSSERMRQVGQYRLGVIVGYNARPVRRGAGSCIFLHIWGGPRSPTVGCTAFAPQELETLLRWLDSRRRPTLVQLPAAEYEARRAGWGLP
jgi:D-alanyl-D-alanine dipeptidase